MEFLAPLVEGSLARLCSRHLDRQLISIAQLRDWTDYASGSGAKVSSPRIAAMAIEKERAFRINEATSVSGLLMCPYKAPSAGGTFAGDYRAVARPQEPDNER